MTQPIQQKTLFLPLIGGAIAVLLILTGLGAILLQEDSYRQQKVAEAQVQAQTLASIVAAAVAFDNRIEAAEYLDTLSLDSNVKAAAIYSDDDRLFVGYARDGDPLPQQLPTGVAAMPERTSSLVTVQPIRQRDLVVGTVYLETITEPVSRRITRYGVIGALAILAALIVAMLALGYRAARAANAELERRADALTAANVELRAQIERREAAESALRHAQKMDAMGQLTGGVAHDFNNLLQILNINLTLLKWAPAISSNADLDGAVNVALKAVKRAANLTSQLLAFGRRQPLAPRAFAVNEQIEQMLQLIGRALGETIQIELRGAADLWPTHADPHQFENALLNLAMNARDAMPRGGHLLIQTANLHQHLPTEALAEGDYVAITVTDSGTGMTPEVLEKAFEPFFSTKGVGKATGLGLSQVYGYARQSGGDVYLESHVDAGTRVTLLLPRAETIAPPRSDNSLQARPALAVPRGTVLIVEDEPLLRDATAEIMERLGFHAVVAEDAIAALNTLAGNQVVDILFSDVVLPGDMSGVELAREALRVQSHLRVLLTSGYTAVEWIDPNELARFTMLRKPYDAEALARTLDQLEPHASD